MVVQQECPAIVMLTDLVDKNTEVFIVVFLMFEYLEYSSVVAQRLKHMKLPISDGEMWELFSCPSTTIPNSWKVQNNKQIKYYHKECSYTTVAGDQEFGGIHDFLSFFRSLSLSEIVYNWT